ncbi:MAG TPA: CoA ester lyase [Dehalococcoidia bacterium]|nr:CoA ester lyase [Dehalococcoidia bacterium]
MTVLRSALFVPAIRPEMIEKARGLAEADALVLDLEDSVPESGKEQARAAAREALPSLVTPGRQLWVRVNNTYSLRTRDDVRAVVCEQLDGIMLPKADKPEQVLYLEALLRDAEAAAGLEAGKLRLLLVIESARGLVKCYETARASKRTLAIQLGAEDYVTDLGIERTLAGAELAYPRSLIAVAARAAGVLALDTVYPAIRDEAGLVREAEAARALGCKGKFAIHPAQIEPINRVFTPAAEKVEEARRVVAAYEEAEQQGHGAVQLDGRMVDAPVVARARALIALAEAVAAKGRGVESEPPVEQPARGA